MNIFYLKIFKSPHSMSSVNKYKHPEIVVQSAEGLQYNYGLKTHMPCTSQSRNCNFFHY